MRWGCIVRFVCVCVCVCVYCASLCASVYCASACVCIKYVGCVPVCVLVSLSWSVVVTLRLGEKPHLTLFPIQPIYLKPIY